MILSFTLLLLFQLLGEGLVRTFGLVVPGPVAGMALLLVALLLRPSWHAAVQPMAHTLLRNLSLFFVPAGVGVLALEAELRRDGGALIAVIGISTCVTGLVSGLVFEWIRKRVRL
jgi:holin-like protein